MANPFTCSLILIACFALSVTPAHAVVQEGDACSRNAESSMIKGKYLICTGGIWVGQAPQVVNIGLSNVICNSASLGLLRIKAPAILPGANTLQFCDGLSWKTVTAL